MSATSQRPHTIWTARMEERGRQLSAFFWIRAKPSAASLASKRSRACSRRAKVRGRDQKLCQIWFPNANSWRTWPQVLDWQLGLCSTDERPHLVAAQETHIKEWSKTSGAQGWLRSREYRGGFALADSIGGNTTASSGAVLAATASHLDHVAVPLKRLGIDRRYISRLKVSHASMMFYCSGRCMAMATTAISGSLGMCFSGWEASCTGQISYGFWQGTSTFLLMMYDWVPGVACSELLQTRCQVGLASQRLGRPSIVVPQGLEAHICDVRAPYGAPVWPHTPVALQLRGPKLSIPVHVRTIWAPVPAHRHVGCEQRPAAYEWSWTAGDVESVDLEQAWVEWLGHMEARMCRIFDIAGRGAGNYSGPGQGF